LQRLRKLAKHEKEIMELKQQIASYLQRFVDVEVSCKRIQPPVSHTPQLIDPIAKKPKRIIGSPNVSVCAND